MPRSKIPVPAEPAWFAEGHNLPPLDTPEPTPAKPGRFVGINKNDALGPFYEGSTPQDIVDKLCKEVGEFFIISDIEFFQLVPVKVKPAEFIQGD